MIAFVVVGCSEDQRTGDVPDDPVPDPIQEAACDYADIAGDWSGVTAYHETDVYDTELTVFASAEQGEPVGRITFDEQGTNVFCVDTIVCTGDEDGDWVVADEFAIESESVGGCLDGFAFMKKEDDGRLSYEWNTSRNGPRTVIGVLDPVD